MKTSKVQEISPQSGVALVIVLLFLLVVTVISVTAAMNSSLSIKMTTSLQNAYHSFQSAEAGIHAVLGLTETADDPFDRIAMNDPLSVYTTENHPLNQISGGKESVATEIKPLSILASCPRTYAERGGTSTSMFRCDYYRIKSEHNLKGKARSRVEMGLVKTVMTPQNN